MKLKNLLLALLLAGTTLSAIADVCVLSFKDAGGASGSYSLEVDGSCPNDQSYKYDRSVHYGQAKDTALVLSDFEVKMGVKLISCNPGLANSREKVVCLFTK